MLFRSDSGTEDLHVGLRSGESLALTSLNLKPGVTNQIKVTMVYPADATPGHLLSIVPSTQLASLRERQRQQDLAQAAAKAKPKASKPAVVAPPNLADPATDPLSAQFFQPVGLTSLPPLPPPSLDTGSITQALVERFQQASGNQQLPSPRQVSP